MVKILRPALMMLITAIIAITTPGIAMAADAAPPYLGNMFLYQGHNIEITSTHAIIKVTSGQALVTCDYELINRSNDQLITALYPTGSGTDQTMIRGFAARKNQQILSVSKQNLEFSLPYYKAPRNSYYRFSFPMKAGETTTISNAYLVTLPFDAGLGKFLQYDNHETGGWMDQRIKTIDISIIDFKPYFNVMLFPEQGTAPQKMNNQGSFSYLIDPGVGRQNINLYYQLRGPEAAWQRLLTSNYGQTMLPFMANKDYAHARQQLDIIATNVVSEGVLSPNEISILKAYLSYEQKDYQQAEEELKRIGIKDGAYIYYQILTSLKLKNQAIAGQSLRDIGQSEQQDSTGVSIGLLKDWAEATISQYLAQPAAPVPSAATKPRQHTAILLLTIGLIVIASITITVLMRKKH